MCGNTLPPPEPCCLLAQVANGLLENRVGSGLGGRDLVQGDLDHHLVLRAVGLGAGVLLGDTVAATVVENLELK